MIDNQAGAELAEEFGKGIDVAHRIEGRLNVYCAKMAR
jgi:hypothetical protein